MEPRLLRRGNFVVNLNFSVDKGLQWSHAFSDVETGHILLSESERERASMEPRLLRRGNRNRGHIYRLPISRASMEPRLLRRGNGSLPITSIQSPLASMEPRLLRRGNPMTPGS